MYICYYLLFNLVFAIPIAWFVGRKNRIGFWHSFFITLILSFVLGLSISFIYGAKISDYQKEDDYYE